MLNLMVYTIVYFLSFLLRFFQVPFVSGILLIGAAIYLYWSDYKRLRNLFHLRGLFALSFVGGQGLSALQLSHLQRDWSVITWISFYLAFVGFYAVYEWMSYAYGRIEKKKIRRNGIHHPAHRLLLCMTFLSFLSLSAFLFEAIVLGFIPLFVRGVPHAYSAFHITGVHYFTVSCVLVPALYVIYLEQNTSKGWERTFAFVLCVLSIAIPILCVSRFQLMFAVLLATTVFILLHDHTDSMVFVGAIFALVPIYLILTIARSHGSSYLNSIFEMKYGIPVYVAQPYIYIANNYDNFNRMVLELPRFTFGQKMLFPVFALTGLKFAVPSLVDLPIFVTKKELTTLTLFYDAYYDFGIIGVALFSTCLGAMSYIMESRMKVVANRIFVLFYAQICIYFGFSFFTTWFTNPTTWFYFVVTAIIYLYCQRENPLYHKNYTRKR